MIYYDLLIFLAHLNPSINLILNILHIFKNYNVYKIYKYDIYNDGLIFWLLY